MNPIPTTKEIDALNIHHSWKPITKLITEIKISNGIDFFSRVDMLYHKSLNK